MITKWLTLEYFHRRIHCALVLVLVMLPNIKVLAGNRPFENLQVLPEDISREKLIANMKRISKALGADCRYCHRTDIRDYASDEIDAKKRARQMMRMVDGMNAKRPADTNLPPVTCHSCHRGQRKPIQLTPEIRHFCVKK